MAKILNHNQKLEIINFCEENAEGVVQTFSVKKCFKKFLRLHKEAPVPESSFLIKFHASGLQCY